MHCFESEDRGISLEKGGQILPIEAQRKGMKHPTFLPYTVELMHSSQGHPRRSTRMTLYS